MLPLLPLLHVPINPSIELVYEYASTRLFKHTLIILLL